MRFWQWVILGAGVVISIPFLGKAAEREQTSCPGTLVESKVLSVSDAKPALEATLEVTNVFCGDRAANGKHFIVQAARSGQSSNGLPTMVPPYKAGELQIWIIKRDSKQNDRWVIDVAASHLMNHASGCVSLPARADVKDNRYSQVRAWALAVQKVAAVSEAERRKLLADFAASEIPEIRCWARNVLGVAGQPATQPK